MLEESHIGELVHLCVYNTYSAHMYVLSLLQWQLGVILIVWYIYNICRIVGRLASSRLFPLHMAGDEKLRDKAI